MWYLGFSNPASQVLPRPKRVRSASGPLLFDSVRFSTSETSPISPSRTAATLRRVSGYRCEYRSIVTMIDECPKCSCTDLIGTPALASSDAAVCRISWILRPVGSPARFTAGVHTLRRKFCNRMGSPSGEVNTKASTFGAVNDSRWRSNLLCTATGIATVRACLVFVDPNTR